MKKLLTIILLFLIYGCTSVETLQIKGNVGLPIGWEPTAILHVNMNYLPNGMDSLPSLVCRDTLVYQDTTYLFSHPANLIPNLGINDIMYSTSPGRIGIGDGHSLSTELHISDGQKFIIK